MIEWIYGLPQISGWFLWFDIDGPNSSSTDVVYVARLQDYDQKNRENLGIVGRSFVYANGDGEDLVICWHSVKPPLNRDGSPDRFVTFAPFNFPPSKALTDSERLT